MKVFNKRMWRLVMILVMTVVGCAYLQPVAALAATSGQVNVDAKNEGTPTALVGGETLSFSVKLLNFGTNNRTDAIITYLMQSSSGMQVLKTNETVAVETTASFVKRIVLPTNMAAGNYTMKVSIKYVDQAAPAQSEFSFAVDRKIVGLHQDTFAILVGSTVLALLIMLLLSVTLLRRMSGKTAVYAFDYSHIPHQDRIYYEIISESIVHMRLRAGDIALDIAAATPHLTINEKTGEVLRLSGNPSDIISTLVLRYETLLGRKYNPHDTDGSNKRSSK